MMDEHLFSGIQWNIRLFVYVLNITDCKPQCVNILW